MLPYITDETIDVAINSFVTKKAGSFIFRSICKPTMDYYKRYIRRSWTINVPIEKLIDMYVAPDFDKEVTYFSLPIHTMNEFGITDEDIALAQVDLKAAKLNSDFHSIYLYSRNVTTIEALGKIAKMLKEDNEKGIRYLDGLFNLAVEDRKMYPRFDSACIIECAPKVPVICLKCEL